MNSIAKASISSIHDWADQPYHVLLVDDEKRMRSSLRLLLECDGRCIRECATGREAIALLGSQAIDLVLLDINLPDISGLEVVEWIAQHKIPTSVIMVSADSQIESVIQAMRNGAVEFVRKPNGLAEIPHKVDNILHRRSLERNHVLMTARLEQSERLHRFLVENSPDLIYTLDSSGYFMFINNRVESLLGYSREELIGCHYAAIVHDDDVNHALYAFTERRSDSRAAANVEVRLKCKNNHYRRFESTHIVAMLSAMGIYDVTNSGQDIQTKTFLGTYGVARDITERKMAEETINFQALHDQLTHLPNRRLFKDRLELALIQAKRSKKNVGVMFIDLDRFKLVNDTHGHAAGDDLLNSLAQRLLGCMRSGDTLARQGGDEFTVLLPDLQHAEDAIIIAEKIQQTLVPPFIVRDQDFRATASIGISIFPRDGASADVLLKNADIAMYKVKTDGKNGFLFFNPDMNACYHERLNLENELRLAVQNSEFELYYQPQISVSTGQIVGLEALIRWQHPVHGLLSPDHFIGMAEESGLICSITDWVLEKACSQLALWRSRDMLELRMSINVSPQEFDRIDMVERIITALARHNLPANVLEIEITENLLLRDVASVIDTMRKLSEHGIRISIDDFGTRYSSLNYLRRFPIDSIKIDQSFVRDLQEGKSDSPIIHAIIGIAHGFGLHLVVEGVETAYQMKTLQELGCDEMQGYYFSRPVPAAEADFMLTSGTFINKSQFSYSVGAT